MEFLSPLKREGITNLQVLQTQVGAILDKTGGVLRIGRRTERIRNRTVAVL